MERMNRQNNCNNTARQGNAQGCRRNGTCGMHAGSANNCTAQALMRKIREIDFAIYETILYLDAYPHCTEALDYYHSLIHQRELLAAEYEGNHTPITAFGNKSHSSWDWISSPWPWELSAN